MDRRQQYREQTRQEVKRLALLQLAEWGEQLGHGQYTERQQHWGLTVWTRLHGLLSLEVAGQFSLTGVDPALLYLAEVEALIAWWE